jgi:hypothetical protein
LSFQAFIDLLSTQLSSDVARLIKDLKTQAEEAVREAEKFDKIRADFSGTVQKIEVNAAQSLYLLRVLSRLLTRCADNNAESSRQKRCYDHFPACERCYGRF